MFSNRRLYHGLKLSIADFFREPVRYLKQSNTQESMMEKPYLVNEYPKMHLSLPDFKHKPKEGPPGLFGSIASGVPPGGLAYLDFGEAGCGWDILNTGYCIKEPVVITMSADYFFHAEFEFAAQIAEDTIGVTLAQLPGTEAFGWDDQEYLLTFPEDASGSVTICGFASTNTLTSQTFETVVAGMPVGIYISGGGLVVRERGQVNPALCLKSSYGTKGANCGCITIESSCDPCAAAAAMSWDDDASADTIARSASVSIAVQDGLGPYNWSVSGTGFTLGTAQTAGVSNTLSADGAACGSATITITDQCRTTTGYVRCTTGGWVYKGDQCDLAGEASLDSVTGADFTMVLTSGNKKQEEIFLYGGYATCRVNGPGTECTDTLSYCCSESTAGSCLSFSTPCSSIPAGFPFLCEFLSCRNECACAWPIDHANRYCAIAKAWWNLGERSYYEWEC